MAHLSWLLEKSFQAEKQSMEKDTFYYILLLQQITHCQKKQLAFFKFIENGHITRHFDEYERYIEEITIDGERRAFVISKTEPAEFLIQPKIFKHLSDSFEKGFKNSFFILTDKTDRWIFKKEQMIYFIKTAEKECQHGLLYPNSTEGKTYFSEKFPLFLSKLQHFTKEEYFSIYNQEKEKFNDEKQFFKRNIFKIINAFSNKSPERNSFYLEILNHLH